jgi:superfamily II DNA or RNA helicase
VFDMKWFFPPSQCAPPKTGKNCWNNDRVESRIDQIEEELAALATKKAALDSELALLRASPQKSNRTEGKVLLGKPAWEGVLLTDEERTGLFLRLFRCRQAVHAKLWENPAKGIKGYSPVCANEWIRGICGKPPHGNVRCSECPNQAFRPLDEVAIGAHLRGHATIGSYAIREDDSCVFLACDFDGPGWLGDVNLYTSIARQSGVEVLVERSRSGNGSHAWIFFTVPVPARVARALGTLILARCGEENHRLGLDSYDRFFPNQDYLPKGGFGNLIALPLQGKCLDSGNTAFIDSHGVVWPNQWAILSKVHRLEQSDVQALLRRHLPGNCPADREDVSLAADRGFLEAGSDIRDILPSGFPMKITRAAQIRIPLEGLPSKLVAALRRMASFPNPEFYKLQRMRMQTYPHPRFIFAGELRSDHLLLPRGLLDLASKILRLSGADLTFVDAQVRGNEIDVCFSGILTVPQDQATRSICRFDDGVLVALPGVGKTVIACAVIAERKVSTLILVHKQPLAEQWKEQLATFLGINVRNIGVFAGAKKRRTGQIDIAMLQTLTKSPECAAILAQYGMVVVDECHHVPATSFEAVMKQCPVKFVVGLTATPRRKDGLENLLYLQCGPIRHQIKENFEGLAKRVIIRETNFRLPEDVGQRPPYHVIAHLLSSSEKRNALIVADLATALESDRFPLVLSDRKDQIETLMSGIKIVSEKQDAKVEPFLLEGGMSAKKRRATLECVSAARHNGSRVCLFATAYLIGEGFDMPELDTLFLTMPLSFEGRLIQYAGRLNRSAPGKTEILVHDYVDSYCAVSLKMYRGRVSVFRKMGYVVEGPRNLFGRNRSIQVGLFD